MWSELAAKARNIVSGLGNYAINMAYETRLIKRPEPSSYMVTKSGVSLPDDVVKHILELAITDSRLAILNLSLVCQKWREFIAESPEGQRLKMSALRQTSSFTIINRMLTEGSVPLMATLLTMASPEDAVLAAVSFLNSNSHWVGAAFDRVMSSRLKPVALPPEISNADVELFPADNADFLSTDTCSPTFQ